MSLIDVMGAPEHVTTDRTPQASRLVMFAKNGAGTMQEHAMQAGIRAGKGPVQNRQRRTLCKEHAAETLEEAHQVRGAPLRAYASRVGLSLICDKDGGRREVP